MTPSQRANLEHSERFQQLSEKAQAHVLRRRAALEEVEDEADFEHARWLEEQELAAYEDSEPATYWPEDSAPLTESERRAEADLAAASSGPLYTGDPEEVYSDNIEEDYDLEEEGEDE
jgi:hypothetical protein